MKFKYLSVDTCSIKNEYSKDSNFGYIKKREQVLRLGSKSKLSLIVNSYGIPLSAHLDKESISDQEFYLKI